MDPRRSSRRHDLHRGHARRYRPQRARSRAARLAWPHYERLDRRPRPPNEGPIPPGSIKAGEVLQVWPNRTPFELGRPQGEADIDPGPFGKSRAILRSWAGIRSRIAPCRSVTEVSSIARMRTRFASWILSRSNIHSGSLQEIAIRAVSMRVAWIRAFFMSSFPSLAAASMPLRSGHDTVAPLSISER